MGMSSPLALESQVLALELHATLRDLDPVRFRTERGARVRERLADLEVRVTALVEGSLADPGTALRQKLRELSELLRSRLPSVDVAATITAWVELRSRLMHVYEALAASLRRHAMDVPSLRPTNYTRNLFHVAMAAVALGVIVFLPDSMLWLVVPFFIAGWTMETTRRMSDTINVRLMKLFGPVAHPHETHRINSATWYTSALLGLALVAPFEACAVGVVVLGLGDPVAAVVGRRFGRTKLLHGRSLEGSLAFFVVGFVGALLTLQLAYPSLTLPVAAAMAGAGALSGAVAELLSHRVDDNMTVPWSAAAACWLVATLLAS